MVSRGTRSVRKGPQRKTVWARQKGNLTTGAGPTVSTVNVLNNFLTDLGANQVLGMTVIRSLLYFKVVEGAAGFWTVGQIVTNAGGATSLNPSTDEHADWMYWRSIQNGPADSVLQQWDADIHSMRRLDEVEQDLQLRFISETEGDVLAYSGSWLIKLP